MTISKVLTGTCLAGAVSLALATSALAAPAGDEYLPSIPKAGGNQSGGSQSGSSASSVPVPSSSGTGGPSSSTGANGNGNPAAKSSPAQPSSSNDSSDGGSPLLDPVVILLVAGVIVTAVGMTLVRRHSDGSDSDWEDEPETDDAPNARPTPDGEIVAGGERNH